jgi:hypothetical protein
VSGGQMNLENPSPRIPLKLEIEYKRSYSRNADKAELKNISLTGAFLETEGHDLKENDKVAIEFKVGGRARKIVASIIWTKDNGCGIKFLPNSNRDVQIVDDLMYFIESKRENRKSVMYNIFKKVA